MAYKVGDFYHEDYFENVGGLNLSDSPFRVLETQATGGKNWEYTLTGGFRKRDGHSKVNSVVDTRLRSVGFGQHVTASGTKTQVRAADRKLQAVDLTTPSFTALSDDTSSAATDILAASNTQQVVASQFNTTAANALWLAGGGMASLYGVYSATKVTKNGVPAPTGSLSLTASAHAAAPNFAATGYYRYAIAFRKLSTQALSNAALFKEINITTATDQVTVSRASVSNVDTTRFDKWYIYRSSVSVTSQGDTAFTAGDLVAIVDIGTTSYADTGGYISTAQNVPGAGNTIDNSELASGTYKTLTTWKRRLVTAYDSTICISDTNKPESWPVANVITVPSGGPITSLSIISFTSANSDAIEEMLVVHKDEELWVVTGSSVSDWVLKKISDHGVAQQAQVVTANGYLAWVSTTGVYIWDGTGKPTRASRPIQALFETDGDIDKSKIDYAWGAFNRRTQTIVWVLSHLVHGDNKFCLKLDLKLTLGKESGGIGEREMDGVFLQDSLPFALYAGSTMKVSGEEVFLAGDDAGYCYKLFNSFNDSDAGVDFAYESKYADLGAKGVTKRIHKVIAWVADSSDGDLRLDWWMKYQGGTEDSSSMSLPVSQAISSSLYDLSSYDAAYWDSAVASYSPLVFNLQGQRGTEGDCIKLKFSNSDLNAPVTIAGFTIIYSVGGVRK